MGEKEKRIIETVADALPNMSEFDKGYMLATIEINARNNEEKNAAAVEQKGA